MPPDRPPTRASVTIGRVRGVPLRVHWTLLFALPVFAWIMARAYFVGEPFAWVWGAALAVALFASVAVHELAHTLVALRRGTRIREIILFPIGGASVMERPNREPRAELAIAIVGPLASLAIGLGLLGVAAILGVPAALPTELPAAPAFLLTLGVLNVVLGLFNLLIPAFPMDGGRVLHAILSARFGLLRATRIAAAVGRGVAFLMAAAGLLIGNIFLIAIAFFVWVGGRAEEQSVIVATTLEGVEVQDIMTREPAIVAPEASVAEALQVMLDTKHVALLVVAADDHPTAVLSADRIGRVPPAERAILTVGSIADPAVQTAAPEDPAPQALAQVMQAGLVAVIDRAGALLGVITPTDILRIVEIRTRSSAP